MSTKLGTIIADFNTTIAAKISVGGTSATLVSATDDDGVALPSGKYYFTIDGDNTSKEHIVCDLSSTALTNIKSVSRQGAESSGVVREHRAGATITITDFAHIKHMNDLLKGSVDLDSTDPLKYDGTATINNDAHLATKKYVDDSVVSGASNMSTTVKGIAEEATAAEINAGTQAGGTGAELAVNPKYLKDSEYYTQRPTSDQKAAMDNATTPSSGNPFVTNSVLSAYESLSNKDTTTTLGTSNTKYPSQLAVKTYVDTQVATKQGMLSTPSSKIISSNGDNAHIYQATTDGFVFFKFSAGSGTYTVSLITDSSATPTTIVATASTTGYLYVNHIMYPIKKNNYYNVDLTGSGGSGTGITEYVFIPLSA